MSECFHRIKQVFGAVLMLAAMLNAGEMTNPAAPLTGQIIISSNPNGGFTATTIPTPVTNDVRPTAGKTSDNLLDGPSVCNINISQYDTVDIHAQNVKVSTVLQELAVKSHRNIILAADSDRVVSATIYSVPFYEALDVLLEVNGLAFGEEGDFIKVFTKEQMQQRAQGKNGMEARVFSLNYLRANDAKEAVAGVLSKNGSVKTITDDKVDGGSGGGNSSSDTVAAGDDPVYNPNSQPFVYNNTIVVYDYRDNVAAAAQLLTKLDRRPKQILIETTVLEVSVTDENKLGVDFSLFGGTGNFRPFDLKTFSSATPGADNNNSSFKGGISFGDSAQFMIEALDSISDVSVLSSPKVMSLDRQRAKVMVGQKLSYQEYTVSQGVVSPSTKWIEAGISLDVRPHIMEDGKIRLTALPKVATPSEYKVPIPNSGTPPLQQTLYNINVQYVAADILLPPGATAVIGGLFTENLTKARSQVPGLGDVPVLGVAARRQSEKTNRRELIFLIHPVVLSDEEVEKIGNSTASDSVQALAGSRQGLLPWSRARQSESLALRSLQFARGNQKGLSDWTARRAKNLSQDDCPISDVANDPIDTGILHENIRSAVKQQSDGRSDKLITSSVIPANPSAPNYYLGTPVQPTAATTNAKSVSPVKTATDYYEWIPADTIDQQFEFRQQREQLPQDFAVVEWENGELR